MMTHNSGRGWMDAFSSRQTDDSLCGPITLVSVGKKEKKELFTRFGAKL